MRIVPLLALRALTHRPARSIFAALGVALGVATVIALLVLDETTIEAERARRSTDYARADLEVRPLDESPGARERLRAVPGVADAAGAFFGEVLASNEGHEVARLTLVGLDPGAGERFGAYRLAAGRDLADAAASLAARAEPVPVLLGEAIARETGLGPGARLSLKRVPDGALSGCFDGEIRPRPGRAPPAEPYLRECAVAGILGPERLGRYADGRVAVVAFDEGLRLFEGAFVAPVYWVKKEAGISAETLRARLREGFAVASTRTSLAGEEVDERAFRNGVRFSGVLALVLGLFVIFHTLTTALVERARHLAALHALGATRGQLGRAFLLEAAAISIAGAAGGIGLGLLLAKGLLRAGVTTLGVREPLQAFVVPWRIVLGVAGLGAAVALLGAAYPLAFARRLPAGRALLVRDVGRTTDVFRGVNRFALFVLLGILPAAYIAMTPLLAEARGRTLAVFAEGAAIFGVGLGAILFAPSLLAPACRRIAAAARARFPFEGLLGGRNLEGSPARVASSVAALALVGASLLALKSMTASLRAETEDWGREALEGKVFFTARPAVPYARLREVVAGLPGAAGLEPCSPAVHAPFLIRALKTEDAARYGPLAGDADLSARFREKGVILSGRLARSLSVRVGDPLSLPTDAGPRFLEVVAVSDAYGFDPAPSQRSLAVLDAEVMRRFFCVRSDAVDRFSVRCAPGADPGRVGGALLSALGPSFDVRARTGREILDFELRDLTRDFLLFDVILGLVAILAGVGLLNVLLIAGLERSKEIGVLRALGMTGGQLARAVSIEAAATGLLGGIGGVALGIPFAWVVVAGLRALSAFDLPHRLPGVWIGATLLGALALSLLAAGYPVARLRRLSVVEAIRYE
ncbi:MAG TPA: FtsX-like permease family protein [Planctomycetota bacterium]|nr:FtsX-like permease family protein [Planctomycetota bacterium]